MSTFGMKSRGDLGVRLRVIARIAADSRRAAEEQDASPHRDPRQITLGQILLLVALWAIGAAAWRLAW
jgi:hypothetical protein